MESLSLFNDFITHCILYSKKKEKKEEKTIEIETESEKNLETVYFLDSLKSLSLNKKNSSSFSYVTNLSEYFLLLFFDGKKNNIEHYFFHSEYQFFSKFRIIERIYNPLKLNGRKKISSSSLHLQLVFFPFFIPIFLFLVFNVDGIISFCIYNDLLIAMHKIK